MLHMLIVCSLLLPLLSSYSPPIGATLFFHLQRAHGALPHQVAAAAAAALPRLISSTSATTTEDVRPAAASSSPRPRSPRSPPPTRSASRCPPRACPASAHTAHHMHSTLRPLHKVARVATALAAGRLRPSPARTPPHSPLPRCRSTRSRPTASRCRPTHPRPSTSRRIRTSPAARYRYLELYVADATSLASGPVQ